MSRVNVVKCGGTILVTALALGTAGIAAAASMTAEAIVERNVAARGGEAAWHGVNTLTWSGKLEAGGNNQRYFRAPGMPAPPPVKDPNAQVQLPFSMDMQRGRRSRLEIVFDGKTAVQVYDGARGWKLRPFLNRDDVEPFTDDELKAAGDAADLDGLLIDHAAKGTKIELEGTEPVEGKPAYKLKLTLKSGHVLHDWVDAQTYFEVKLEGTPRKLDGRWHRVAIFLRDYRAVDGLKIPHLIETTVQGVRRTEKIEIEKVVVNPRLDASRFARPS